MAKQLCLSFYQSSKACAKSLSLSLSLSLSGSEITLMEQSKEKNAPWLSVPQFGDWDMKGQVPDYSMDFSKIREMRKQNKTNISRASLGNEEELMTSTTTNINTDHSETERQHPHYHQTSSPTTRRSFLSYFNCCVKA
ncbi:uncharacterized protein LOC113863571 isoform X2 [Abrus precatorius]|uniref:Uncharacterized protein LOC113863571 isoform X2 n=1 Tax=Abrus precatorius TaxID=3816 RepID=A0A8B8LE18_ABRPR|nr:uncharacterized protein LOC113863571 isoform X2 [Abrus precatorius]